MNQRVEGKGEGRARSSWIVYFFGKLKIMNEFENEVVIVLQVTWMCTNHMLIFFQRC